MSAHRGANDPLMKAPDVKPKTREEARALLILKPVLLKSLV